MALSTGVATPETLPAARIVLGNATLTLAAFIGISWVLEQTGVCRWVALQVARQPLGKGRSLLVLMALATAMVSAVLTNCGAVLLVMPIALEILTLLRWNPKATFAFAVACGFMADWSSLPFTTSNLVNTIAASYTGISWGRYALVMVPVSAMATATGVAVLLFYFWRYIPDTYSRFDWNTSLTALPPGLASSSPRTVKEGDRVSLPPSVNSSNFSFDPISGGLYGSEALDTISSYSATDVKRDRFPFNRSVWFQRLNSAPVQAILFSAGMYATASSLSHAGFTASLSSIFTQLADWGLPLATIGSCLFATIQAGVMNNLPATAIEISAIQSATIPDAGIREGMIDAVVIGCVLGAKISPIGSLSTLLWLGILERHGFHLNWSRYCRLSLILTLPIVLVALLTLTIWLSILS